MGDEEALIRVQMSETLASLTGKLEELEEQVSASVQSVKDSVHSVRETVDLKRQFRQRPWPFVSGAAAIGFLIGFRSNNHSTTNGTSAVPNNTHGSVGQTGSSAGVVRPPMAHQPSWLANLGESFRPEIAELKGLAIGTLLGVAREIITNQFPRPSEPTQGSDSNGSLHTQKQPVPDVK